MGLLNCRPTAFTQIYTIESDIVLSREPRVELPGPPANLMVVPDATFLNTSSRASPNRHGASSKEHVTGYIKVLQTFSKFADRIADLPMFCT
jgi:hypothetical protein